MAKNKIKNIKKKTTPVAHKKKQSPGTKHNRGAERSTFNEDRRRKAEEAGKVVGVKPLTKEELGEKLYACLVPDCEQTFDVWRTATRHMRQCDHGQLPEGMGKPRIYDSRKKANELLEEGRAEVKTYPVPTEEEIAAAVRQFYAAKNTTPNAKTTDEQRKRAYQLVVVKTWGPGEFSRFGFGEFEEFADRHAISPAVPTTE